MRKELLAILRNRAAGGYYDRPDVIDRAARALVRYLHLRRSARAYSEEWPPSSSAAHPDS